MSARFDTWHGGPSRRGPPAPTRATETSPPAGRVIDIAGVDEHATRLGLSRVDYIRRRLAADAATSGEAVSAVDLRSLADLAGDLFDPEVMGAAWQ